MGTLFSDPAVRKRFGTGFWALADQGAVSLGNFMTQIVLARNLSHSQYGVFALIFGVLLFMFTCQGGLIAYPLSLDGAAVSRPELRKIAFAAAVLTLFLAIPFCLPVIGAAVVLHAAAIAWAAILAMLFWQLQETFRRALMSHLRHAAAFWGDALSYGGQGILVWVLAREGALTLERIFLIVALTSAAAALLQSLQVGWSVIPLSAVLSSTRKYWSSGKWALLSGMNESGVSQFFPWMLALLYSPTEAASFQAIINIVGVTHPVIFGINNLVIPAAAEERKNRGIPAAFRTTMWYGMISALFTLPFFAALIIWPRPALVLFYGSLSPYVALGSGIRVAAVTYLMLIFGSFLAAYLFGIGRPKYVFVANFASTAVAVIPAAILIARHGVIGAIAGLLTFVVIRLLFWIIFSRQTLRRDGPSLTSALSSSYSRTFPSERAALMDSGLRK